MRDKLKHNESALKFYYKKRKELITYLGGKCVYCGTTENLEFDHINLQNSFIFKKSLRQNSKSKKEFYLCQIKFYWLESNS